MRSLLSIFDKVWYNRSMKLIAQVKLLPMDEQHSALFCTLETTNKAANDISQRAWETKTLRQYDLHKLLYHDIRQRFELSAQVVVRVIAKVADAYKLDYETMRVFKRHGSIAYDQRILSWRLSDKTVSIWAMGGRQRIAPEFYLDSPLKQARQLFESICPGEAFLPAEVPEGVLPFDVATTDGGDDHEEVLLEEAMTSLLCKKTYPANEVTGTGRGHGL